jgi:hypothetical protein
MDADLSAWTGLTTLTITGSESGTPGMLYFKNGTDGHLKFRTGTNYGILGTNVANLGRLLANHDGTWPAGNTDDPLTFASKAVIQLEGTSRIMGTYLAIKLFCAQPTNASVETYGTAYTCTDQTTDVNTTTGVITFTGAPPSAGTPVMIKSSGTLPTGLTAIDVYYTRIVSGNTCKLALKNADENIVIPSATGSGMLTMYSGHTNTSTATMNVVQDVTADTPWVTTDGHDYVCLADCNAPESYDQQRTQLTTINAGTIVLSANVDSAQYPLARIFLVSRNVSIRFTGNTAVNILDAVHDSILQCEIRATAGTGTTFYGYGLNNSYSNTISGTISGCSSGLNNSYSNTISGTILGCNIGLNNSYSNTISGTISGCRYGLIYSYSNTISGTISGCGYGLNASYSNTISGTISGCNYGLFASYSNTISGTISGCGDSLFTSYSNTISGTISGCSNGLYNSYSNTISGTISGCSYGLYISYSNIISGTILGCVYGLYNSCSNTISGTISGCSYISRNSINNTIRNNSDIGAQTVIYGINTAYEHNRLKCENLNRVNGAHKIYDNYGDVLKTACDGTGDAPSVDPDSGSGYCLEASNIQQNCVDVNSALRIIEDVRIWLAAGTHTLAYKVQTTYTTSVDLVLTIDYIGTDGVITRATKAAAVATRDNDADWTKTITSDSFTTTEDGWITVSLDLVEYEANDEVYVWPKPTITWG